MSYDESFRKFSIWPISGSFPSNQPNLLTGLLESLRARNGAYSCVENIDFFQDSQGYERPQTTVAIQ